MREIDSKHKKHSRKKNRSCPWKKGLALVLVCLSITAGALAGIWITGYLERTDYDLEHVPFAPNYIKSQDVRASLIEGRVVDEQGRPLPHVWVGVGKEEEDQPFVKLETDENGYYAWEIGSQREEYYLVFQKEGYVNAVMAPDLSDPPAVRPEQIRVILQSEDEDKDMVYPVFLTVPDADLTALSRKQEGELREGLQGVEYEEPLNGLSGAEIIFYRGINRTEDPALRVKTKEGGKISAALKKGAYTIQIKKDGYSTQKAVYYAGLGERNLTFPAVKQAESGWQILLRWDALEDDPIDLDCFAVSEDGFFNTLNRGTETDGRYYYDSLGKTAYEMIELPDKQHTDFRYYVTDYQNVMGQEKGQENSQEQGPAAIGKTHAVVSVYKNGRLMETFRAPKDAVLPVWMPFEIRDGRMVVNDRWSEHAEDGIPWNEDKFLARLNSKEMNLGAMVSDGEWLYFSNMNDANKLYYVKKDGTGLTKLSDDSLEGHGDKILLGDWIYYCTGDESGWGNAVCRIRTDGSGREVVRELTDGAWLKLAGAANGRIFIWKRKDVGGELLYILEDGSERSIAAGTGPCINYVGNSIYYINEAGYGGSQKGLHSYQPDTGADQLLIPDVDWYQFEIKNGYFYFDQGMSISRMRPGEEAEVVGWSEEGAVSSFRLYEDQLFYYSEGDLFRANLDGSDRRCIRSGVGWYDIMDGELYTDRLEYEPILVSDLEGGQARSLFDVTSYRKTAAAQAYGRFLEERQALPGTSGRPSYSSFALVDINGDGVDELFYYSIQDGAESEMLYGYDFGLYLIKELGSNYKYGGTVVFNQERRILLTRFRYGEEEAPEELTVYKTEGKYLEQTGYGCRYLPGYTGDDPKKQEMEAMYEMILRQDWNGSSRIAWVENTEENRNYYVYGGIGTGFNGVMSEY